MDSSPLWVLIKLHETPPNAINSTPGATITGFDRSAGDKLLFSSADGQFSNMAHAPTSLNVIDTITGHTATIAGPQFIYQQDTHQLWYDADGAGNAAAVLIATLDPAKNNFGSALTAADFVLHA